MTPFMELHVCPVCKGPADNGFDRCFPPSPYLCTKCMDLGEAIERNMKIVHAEFTLTQEIDSCDSSCDEYQYLYVKIEDAGAGPYVAFNTSRWAIDFDDEEEVAEFIETMKKLQGMVAQQ